MSRLKLDPMEKGNTWQSREDVAGLMGDDDDNRSQVDLFQAMLSPLAGS